MSLRFNRLAVLVVLVVLAPLLYINLATIYTQIVIPEVNRGLDHGEILRPAATIFFWFGCLISAGLIVQKLIERACNKGDGRPQPTKYGHFRPWVANIAVNVQMVAVCLVAGLGAAAWAVGVGVSLGLTIHIAHVPPLRWMIGPRSA